MNWDDYFMQLAHSVAEKSKDDKKVGVVIVRGNDLLSIGFNGLPRGVSDEMQRFEHPLKDMCMEHAESNAVNNAARNGIALIGSKAYVTWFPCADCARRFIQVGVREVVYGRVPDTSHKRWGDSFIVSMEMLSEAGVVTRHYVKENTP